MLIILMLIMLLILIIFVKKIKIIENKVGKLIKLNNVLKEINKKYYQIKIKIIQIAKIKLK